MSGALLDYLVIGHVTRDRTPAGGFTPGGTAAYAARTARALGLRVGVITSTGTEPDLTKWLAGIEVLRVPAPETTTFDNRYTPSGRMQTVRAVAAALTPEIVGPVRQEASLVHLGPVAGECDPALADLFAGAFLGLTPQGWMRRWDGTGRVVSGPWESAEMLLPRADAVVLSEEDVGGDEALVARWAARTRILAVTRGAAGCSVYADGALQHFPAFPVAELDPTGAGDVFAAVFFVRLWQGDDPYAAARLANCVAAASVTRQGLSGTPTPEEVARCQALCS